VLTPEQRKRLEELSKNPAALATPPAP